MIEIDSGYLRGPETVCPKTPLHIREMTSKETIQTVKEDIALLQEKLKKLEEMEKHKSPVEEAYKRVYGNYPDTGICNGMSYVWWDVFCKGYNEAHKDAIENNKNFEPTPQTPEQVEQGLRDAMKKAKEDGVFEKPKPKTLYDALDKLEKPMFIDDVCRVVERFLVDEAVIENEDHEYITFTLQKSLLEFTNV
jgi:hypothetical protein